MKQVPLLINPLFVGLTRPAMIWGVSMEYWGGISMFTLCGYILFLSPVFLLLYLPLHTLGVVACAIDPHIFRLLLKRCDCLPVVNRRLWGCQSYAPY